MVSAFQRRWSTLHYQNCWYKNQWNWKWCSSYIQKSNETEKWWISNGSWFKWSVISCWSRIEFIFYISGKPEESDSENEDDPEDEEVIDKIRDRLPDDEEVLNEFLVRSLAIFMLLRNVSHSNFSLRISNPALAPTVFETKLRLRIYLKQAYNLSDKRIESYANDGSSDQSKAKPCVRKTGPCFEPMEVIQYLNHYNRNRIPKNRFGV